MSISDRLDEIETSAQACMEDRPADPNAVELAVRVPAMVSALRAVLDLHRPRNGHADCGHCVDPADAHWGIPWPCPTVRVINAALGEEA